MTITLTLWSLVAGSLHATAFLPAIAAVQPGGFTGLPAVLQAISLVMLLWVLGKAKRPAVGAWLAWSFGLTWLLGSTAWLFVSLHRFGGLPAWMAVLSMVLLSAALSLYLAVAGGLWVRWRQRLWLSDAWLFAGLWLLAELARAWVFTGFPWAASGYALVDTPWSGLAPWLGVYGMGAVMVAAVAMVVLSLVLRQQQVLAVLLSVCLFLGAGALTKLPLVQAQGKLLQVTLVQGNVPQDEKFALHRQVAALQWHATQLQAAKGDLVMIPETAIPLLPADLPADFWSGLLTHFHSSGTAALVGVPMGSLAEGYSNSVVGVSAQTKDEPEGIYRYNKHHLVPFGEFIPDGFRWFVSMMNIPLGDFARGPKQAPSFAVADQWVAPNICYEDLFGEELATRFVGGPTPPPTILANVSNLAWFGESVAIGQHLQVARLRSIEFQRPTLRATNTGATVVIDHHGQVTAQWPLNQQGVLQATVQGTQGLTPFAQWAGRWGLLPLLLAGVVLVLLCKKG